MTKREAIVCMIGTFMLGFLSCALLVQTRSGHEPIVTQTAGNAPIRAVELAQPSPKFAWSVIADETVELQPGQIRRFGVEETNDAKFRVESTTPISATFESARENCSAIESLTAERECNLGGHGEFALIDKRTPEGQLARGVLAWKTKNSSIAAAAMPARVHFVLSRYECIENCPR